MTLVRRWAGLNQRCGSAPVGECRGGSVVHFGVGAAGLTWGIALYDRQVVQLEGCIASAAGKPNYVVLSVVDKLGALLNVDVVCADIEHYPNVAFILRRRGKMKNASQKYSCLIPCLIPIIKDWDWSLLSWVCENIYTSEWINCVLWTMWHLTGMNY